MIDCALRGKNFCASGTGQALIAFASFGALILLSPALRVLNIKIVNITCEVVNDKFSY